MKTSLARYLSLGVLMVLIIASCSKDKDSAPANQTTIKTTGDAQTLAASDNKVAITIPAGAIPAGTEVKITANTTVAPGGIGTTYTLEPAGLTFSAPVTLTFQGTDDLNRTIVGAAFREGTGSWTPVADVALNRATHEVQVTTTHFSEWTLVEAEGLLIVDPNDSVHFFSGAQMQNIMDSTTVFVQDTTVSIWLPDYLIDHAGGYDNSHYLAFSLLLGWEVYRFDSGTAIETPGVATFTQAEESVEGISYLKGTFAVPTYHSVFTFVENQWVTHQEVTKGVYRYKKP